MHRKDFKPMSGELGWVEDGFPEEMKSTLNEGKLVPSGEGQITNEQLCILL